MNDIIMVDTSQNAWEIVKPTLKQRQKEIYDAVLKYPNHTAAELGVIISKPVNSISGRFSELGSGTDKHPGMNVIMRVERRECAVTKNDAWTWKVK